MDTSNAPLNSEEEEEKQSEDLDITPTAMAMIAVALALPADIYITHLGNAEKGRAAFIFVATTFATIMFRWKFRRKWWFWTTIVIIGVIESYLLQRISWYKGSLPPVSLLPVAMTLSAIQFGCIALVRKIMSGGSSK